MLITPKPPLAIAATNVSRVDVLNDNAHLWKADIKTVRYGHPADEFKEILFMEAFGTASIAGVEFENGYPEWLYPEHASRQQAFINFLREETIKDNEALGFISQIFDGHEYAAIGKATAAYIVARGVPLAMGVGFKKDDVYSLYGIDPVDNHFIELAKSILPYDELGGNVH